MPKYFITDNVSGRTLTVEADSPPTQQEAAELFSATSQEMVAGTPAQMQEQRARNLQRELGLQEEVAPSGGAPIASRAVAGFAPTAEEKAAFWRIESGREPIPLSSNKLLVYNNGKWTVDNPKGLDMGDIAEMASGGPELIAGMASGLANTPLPGGPLAKAVVASGISSFAANTVGAIQDASFRYLTGGAIDPAEIAKRRGVAVAGETALGAALPIGFDRLTKVLRERKAGKSIMDAFKREGLEGKAALKDAGINVEDSSLVADALRSMQKPSPVAGEAGERIAKSINELDSIVQQGSQRMIERAGADVQRRALAQLGGQAVKPDDAGMAVIGGTKQFVEQQRDAIGKLYQEAYDEIATAAQAAGEGKYFVSLKNTDKVLKELKASLPRTNTGDVATVFQPLRAQIDELEQMAGVGQKLDSMRLTRTLIGEKLRGKGGPFENVSDDLAKRLYKSLSEDIDNSIRGFSGPGADKLRVANEAYKKLIEPFEDSKLLGDIINDGYKMNPGDLVQKMAGASRNEWAALKTALGGGQAYNTIRRSVADALMGSGEVKIGSQSFADLGTLSRNINALAKESPDVLNEIFGGRGGWEPLKKLADEQAFIASKNGLFTSASMPKMAELMDAKRIADEKGFIAANTFLKRALGAADARRINFADNILNQARKGNTRFLTENADEFVDGFIFSGRHDARYVKNVMNRLPEPVREDVSRAAFQRLFERSRIVAQSTVERSRNAYSADKMVNEVFANSAASARVRAALGEEKFKLAKDWMKYQLYLETRAQKGGASLQRLAGLVSTAPYQNLFAARLVSTALEKAAGSRFISSATPGAVELFSQARVIDKSRPLTGAAIATVQQAMNNPLYGDYLSMLEGFTPEQQKAIDAYLLGQ